MTTMLNEVDSSINGSDKNGSRNDKKFIKDLKYKNKNKCPNPHASIYLTHLTFVLVLI